MSNLDESSRNQEDLLTIGELLSLKEASEQSGFSAAYLRDVAESGRLRAKKIGRNWVTTIAAVDQYKKTRKFTIKD